MSYNIKLISATMIPEILALIDGGNGTGAEVHCQSWNSSGKDTIY